MARISGWPKSCGSDVADLVEGDRVDAGHAPRRCRAARRGPARPCRAATSGSRSPRGRAPVRRAAGPCRGRAPRRRSRRRRRGTARRAPPRAPRRACRAGSPPRRRPGRSRRGGWRRRRPSRPARARSRTSWNSRDDVPPPSAVLSTPRAKRRSSLRVRPSMPRTRLTCSNGRAAPRRRPGARGRPARGPRRDRRLVAVEEAVAAEGLADLPDDLGVVEVAGHRDDHVRRAGSAAVEPRRPGRGSAPRSTPRCRRSAGPAVRRPRPARRTGCARRRRGRRRASRSRRGSRRARPRRPRA